MNTQACLQCDGQFHFKSATLSLSLSDANIEVRSYCLQLLHSCSLQIEFSATAVRDIYESERNNEAALHQDSERPRTGISMQEKSPFHAQTAISDLGTGTVKIPNSDQADSPDGAMSHKSWLDVFFWLQRESPISMSITGPRELLKKKTFKRV